MIVKIKHGGKMEISKYDGNPIITKDDVPFRVNSIFNAGAVKVNDSYILICRIELPSGRSSFIKAESRDGFDFKLDKKPCLTPDQHGNYFKYVEWGIEDPRITKLNGKFYLVYTGYSKYTPLLMMAETADFKKFKIHGPVSEPSNKDAALFPEKIGGKYWKIDRPSGENRRDIWINSSPDLKHWGDYQVLMEPEPGTWETDKIGASSQPVKTPEGWLMLYHGVRGFGITSLYKIGVMLLDLKKPWIVKGKTSEPILLPEHNYERVGDVNNVVFSAGWVMERNGEIKIYYSGADTNICAAVTHADYLISLCV